jgi:ribose transport system substrate-binding protein
MKNILAIAFSLCLCFMSCGGPEENGQAAGPETVGPDETVRLGFVSNNTADFWTIAEAGCDAAAEEFNCDVAFRRPAAATAQEQQQIIDSMLVTGISGIAISPNDPANWTEYLNEVARQVHLITQDSDAPESDRLCYVGTDNYQAGREAGKLIKEALPEGGEVMLFVGKLDAQNARDRKRGIEDEIEGAGITIVDTLTDEADRAKAIANAENALVAYPDLDCMTGLWAYNGPAILTAVRDSGRLGDIKIVAFDEEDATLQGVKDGHIVGTIVQQPYQFGYLSVQLLAQLARGDRSMLPEDGRLIVPVKTIRQDTVDAFWRELRERLGAA